MKYFLIISTHSKGYATTLVAAKNKYMAIKDAREANKQFDNFVPVFVKRISKKYLNFIVGLNNESKI